MNTNTETTVKTTYWNWQQWLFILGLTQLFTPVSICACGKLLIIELVNAMADKLVLFLISHINSKDSNVPYAGLTTENAFSISSVILLIQLITKKDSLYNYTDNYTNCQILWRKIVICFYCSTFVQLYLPR